MWEPGERQSGREVAVRLARAVTPPRFLRRYRERATFRRQVRGALSWGLFALLIYGFLFADGGLASILWRRIRIHQLQGEVAELERREAWLKREMALRQDDHEMIERLARERYGMARPGEKIYRIVEVSETEARRIEREKHRLQKRDAEERSDGSDSHLEARR